LAYAPTFRGGVSVAGINGQDLGLGSRIFGQVITGAGPGGGPHVRVFNGVAASPGPSFLAFDPSFTGGVNVAGGFFFGPEPNGDLVITAPASAARPEVRVFGTGGDLRSSFLAYDASLRVGVSVAVRPVGADGASAI